MTDKCRYLKVAVIDHNADMAPLATADLARLQVLECPDAPSLLLASAVDSRCQLRHCI